MRSHARTVAIAVSAPVLIGGLILDPRSTLAAYLVAWMAYGAIPLGALGILMTSYLVRRAWTEKLHSILAAATSAIPAVAILFLPVLIGLKQLYPAALDLSGMPAFGRVESDEHIWNLVHYVKTLRTSPHPESGGDTP